MITSYCLKNLKYKTTREACLQSQHSEGKSKSITSLRLRTFSHNQYKTHLEV
jgi:hypothetical protein